MPRKDRDNLPAIPEPRHPVEPAASWDDQIDIRPELVPMEEAPYADPPAPTHYDSIDVVEGYVAPVYPPAAPPARYTPPQPDIFGTTYDDPPGYEYTETHIREQQFPGSHTDPSWQYTEPPPFSETWGEPLWATPPPRQQEPPPTFRSYDRPKPRQDKVKPPTRRQRKRDRERLSEIPDWRAPISPPRPAPRIGYTPPLLPRPSYTPYTPLPSPSPFTPDTPAEPKPVTWPRRLLIAITSLCLVLAASDLVLFRFKEFWAGIGFSPDAFYHPDVMWGVLMASMFCAAVGGAWALWAHWRNKPLDPAGTYVIGAGGVSVFAILVAMAINGIFW